MEPFSRLSRTLLATLFLFPFLPKQALSQSIPFDQVFSFSGLSANSQFPRNASVADVDGDGMDDYLLSAVNEFNFVGRVVLYSGSDGSILFERDGSQVPGIGVASTAIIGDLNQDGFKEIIVGAPGDPFGRAAIFDVKNDVLLMEQIATEEGGQFGFTVANAGLVDQDLIEDYVVGAVDETANGMSNAGNVYVYSGANHMQLHKLSGVAAGDDLGFALAAAGDVNGDGFGDILAGTPLTEDNGIGRGKAFVFSGATGAIIRQYEGDANFDLLGFAVTGLGDLNNDGCDDFAIGLPRFPIFLPPKSGLVRIYSGGDGSPGCVNGMLLHTLTANVLGDSFGTSLASAGDIDCDSVADVLVGANGSSTAAIYSGVTGALIKQFNGFASLDNFGVVVAGNAKATCTDIPAIVVGANFTDVGNLTAAGEAFVFRRSPGQPYGTGGPNQSLSLKWNFIKNTSGSITVEGIPQGVMEAIVAVSLAKANEPFPQLPGGANLLVDPVQPLFGELTLTLPVDPSGTTTFGPLDLATLGVPPGTQVFLQAAILVNNLFFTSAGLEITTF